MARAADRLGWSAEDCAPALIELLDRLGVAHDTRFSAQELSAAAMSDKKISGGTAALVSPVRPGECEIRETAAGELSRIFALGLSGG